VVDMGVVVVRQVSARHRIVQVMFAFALVAGGLVVAPSPAAAAGSFVTFDVPGTTTTVANGINRSGAVVGFFPDDTGFHGFLRDPSGVFTTLTGMSEAFGINDHGWIVGIGPGGNVRSPAGQMTTVTVPGPTDETTPTGINNHLDIVGWFFDTNTGAIRGFVRSAAGTYTTFDAPGAVNGSGKFGTQPQGINDAGAISGWYDNGGPYHQSGFLRNANGTFSTFDIPGALRTLPGGISNTGVIVGLVNISDGTAHGFRRSAAGSFKIFDVPGADGTEAKGVSGAGICGSSYQVASHVTHGFIRTG
jgi:hypothetical protein